MKINIMEEIKTPACLFTFDDWWVDEWYEILDLLDSFRVKATFYLSFDGRPEVMMSLEKWGKLREIIKAGHTVGYHSFSHFHILEYIEQHGWEKYESEEILAGIELLRIKGFDIKHFSYPGGHCNDETNRMLRPHFETLRSTEGDGKKKYVFYEKMTYTAEEIKEVDLIHSFDFDKQSQEIRQAIATNIDKAICCYAHIPNKEGLKSFFEFTKEYNVTFYSMDVLNKKNRGD